jgi:hypothetical protein
MLWECRETFARELSYGLPRSAVEYSSEFIIDFKNMVAPFPEEPPHASFQESWTRMIAQYSDCQLTVPGDKLVAISGVASVLSHLSPGDEYLAGLWRSQLPRGLLWFPLKWHAPRPVEWRAPTWSWASVDGYICFQPIYELGRPQANSDLILAEIHSAFSIPVSGHSGMQNGEFGPLKGACLVLDAPFTQVKLNSDTQEKIEELIVGEWSNDHISISTSCEVNLDPRVDSQTPLGTSQSRTFCMESCNFDRLGAEQGCPVQLIGGALYCVSLLYRPVSSTAPPQPANDGVHGLLLSYHEEGYFTRAGMFSIQGDQVVELFKTLPKKRVTIF